MRILANIRGAYLEPFGKVGVRDAVSCLQLQAVNGGETQILQEVYKVLREGGTIRAVADQPGVVQIVCDFAQPLTEAPETSPPIEGVEVAATTEPIPALEPTTDRVHEHVFSTEAPCVHDPSGVWLGCECGEWNYFPRLVDPNDPDNQKTKPPLIH